MRRPAEDLSSTYRLALVEAIFHDAQELPPGVDQSEWLIRTCADESLRSEVEELLNAHRMRTTFDRRRQVDRNAVPGSAFGPYIADATIGRGGMSVVYRAQRRDGQFEQTVALKVLAAHLVAPPFLRRFDRERQLLASLNHHHIAKLLDGGVSQAGEPYLVTEFIDGSMIDRYADEHRLDLRGRVRLVLQVSEALDYAHRHLIVHGDVKPANVLVDREGCVKLLDFGTAVLIERDPSLTATRDRTLTPRYASPEQLRGERVAVASDVYSLGVLLYELLTGGMPFGASGTLAEGFSRAAGHVAVTTPSTIVTPEAAAHRSTTVEQLRRALKGDLTAILVKALAHEPEARYRTVRELADDLARYLAVRPVAARGSSQVYRVRRFVRRHRIRLAAVVGASLLLVGVSAYGVRQYGRAQKRLVQIRELNEAFLSDIYGQVASLPGSTRARLLIVERAQRNLDEVYADNAGDPKLRAALAQSYVQLADTQGEPFAISLGDSAGALVNYRKAESLIDENVDTLESTALLLRARQGIVEVLIRAGEYDQAAHNAERALEPARRLWMQAPPSFRVAGRSASELYVRMNMLRGHALMRYADLTRDVAGVRRALTQFEQTVTVAEDARRRNPELPDLAGRYSQYVGYANELLGDFTGSFEAYRAGRNAHQRSADASAANFASAPTSRNKRDAADGLVWLGWAHATCREYQTAIPVLERALALFEEVATENRDSQELNLDLANAIFRLGAVEGMAGFDEAAHAHLMKAASMVPLPEHVTATDREVVVLIARIHEHLADLLMRKRQPDAAVTAMTKGVAAVSDGHSVPGWRLRELQEKRDLLATAATLARH